MHIPDPSGNYKPLSDIFRPELFDADEEDLKIWNMMRSSVTSYRNSTYNEELDGVLSDGVEMILDHQGKYCGSSTPVIVASYVKKIADKPVEGYNVKLWYEYPTLNIDTSAPCYEELDDYFINNKPIKDLDDFKPDNLPQSGRGLSAKLSYSSQSQPCHNIKR